MSLKVANEKDIDVILEYLRPNIQDCIYMYIDIKKYRTTNPAMKVWYDHNETGDIVLVVMKYHTSISLYSSETSDIWLSTDLLRIIKQHKPNSITGRRDIIEILMNEMNGYYAEYGYVFKLEKFADFGGDELVETANDSDMLEIAKLVTSDAEIGSYYEVQDYADQLLERKHSGMGRSLIVRDGSQIVGHIATYAELDGIATTGGLIVKPSHEGKMFGAILEGFLVRKLLNEGITIFTFVTSRKRYKLLKNMGNNPVGEYGKMMKREES